MQVRLEPDLELDDPSFSEPDAASDALRIMHDEPGCLMAVWRNIAIVVWAAKATVARVERLEQIAKDMMPHHQHGGSTIHLVMEGAPLPDADGRAALLRLSVRFDGKLACVLTVLAGTGFWASAMRGLVTSLHWVRRTNYQARVCAAHEDAAAWFCEHHMEHTKVYVGKAEYNKVLQAMLDRTRRLERAA